MNVASCLTVLPLSLLMLSSCDSSDGTCVTDAPVTVCAINVTEGVQVDVDGASGFASGAVGNAEDGAPEPIPLEPDGGLPKHYRTIVDTAEGSLIIVHLEDVAHTVDISLRASG